MPHQHQWHNDVAASRQLGFKVATVNYSGDAESRHIDSNLRACADTGVKLVRIIAQPCLPAAIESAPWFTGYPLTKVMSFHRVLDSPDIGDTVVPGADASCSVVSRHESVLDLMHMLPDAEDGSSYAIDPALTQASVATMRRANLLEAVNDSMLHIVRCRVDGVTIGFFVLRLDVDRDDPRAIIHDFVLSRKMWRPCAGSLLLRTASDMARTGGATSLVANATTQQVEAIHALRAHGFRQIAQATVHHVWLPTTERVIFNVPHLTGREVPNLTQAVHGNALDSLGPFTRACEAWMRAKLQAPTVLLTHSATAALEQAALLCGLGAGDEVVMPSYTFVSTASSVVLRGATPVFVDVDEASLNVSADRIKAALTPATKAIIVVHYAGIPADMDAIMALANERGLYVIEDAAQAFLSKHRGRYAGTIGHFGCFSFHYTKNTVCGEGGALCVNDVAFQSAAPIVREKGTNRSDFINNKVAKYEWVGLGSSYEPSELSAAFLLAQLRTMLCWHPLNWLGSCII